MKGTKRISTKAQQMYDVIKELGPIKSKDLCEYFGWKSDTSVFNYVSELKNTHPELKSGREGFWIEQVLTPSKEEKVESKNHEGYSDPTAARAINNLANTMMTNGVNKVESEKKEKIYYKQGDVIVPISTMFNADQYVVISATTTGILICLPIYKVNNLTDEGYRKYQVRFLRDLYYVDAQFFTWINVKKTPVVKAERKFADDCPEVLPSATIELVKVCIRDILDLPSETKVIKAEKVATTTITPTTYTDKSKIFSSTDLKLAQQAADIWKKAFYQVTGGNHELGTV